MSAPPKMEVSNRKAWGPDALAEVRDARRRHQEANTAQRGKHIRSNRYFYDHLKQVLQFIVEPGKHVLDVRCETGHLLAGVRPALGVGVEISTAMVDCA